jgi:hypothetical protein
MVAVVPVKPRMITRLRYQCSATATLLAPALLLASFALPIESTESHALSIETIDDYAMAFLLHQDADGGYQLGPRVQRHLKAEIAMALASEATSYPAYAASAALDLDWVVANRQEPTGGLNWDGPSNPFFFECHQHWLLISSEMLRRAGAVGEEVTAIQTATWRYLIETNQAATNFYRDNQVRYGPFFAYRSVDRSGLFQTQAPFKGSYEVGVALWSMSLMRDLDWVNNLVAGSDTVSVPQYLDWSATQASGSPDVLGWYDQSTGRWIRSILWISPGWAGWEAPDWKYALHMEEGALEYSLLTGDGRLEDPCRRFLETLLLQIQPGGFLSTLPDLYGTGRYEYGQALSVLGLAAEVFHDKVPGLSNACIAGAQQVADYVILAYPPECSEDGAMTLAGLSRALKAQVLASPSAIDPQGSPQSARSISLRVWPNPVVGRLNVAIHGASQPGAQLWLADASGRRVGAIPVPSGPESRIIQWNTSDEVGRPLSSGHYWVVLQSGTTFQTTGFTILH